MWIFTQHGFFSATRSLQDPDKFQVRARLRADLESLLALMQSRAGWDTIEILETTHSDYRYRVLLTPAQFNEVLLAVAEKIDYSNFKSRIGQTAGQKSKLGALHQIWEIMMNFQRKEK